MLKYRKSTGSIPGKLKIRGKYSAPNAMPVSSLEEARVNVIPLFNHLFE